LRGTYFDSDNKYIKSVGPNDRSVKRRQRTTGLFRAHLAQHYHRTPDTDRPVMTASRGGRSGTEIKPDGSFELWRLDPGKYTLRAVWMTASGESQTGCSWLQPSIKEWSGFSPPLWSILLCP
jgi:hypothetical protein